MGLVLAAKRGANVGGNHHDYLLWFVDAPWCGHCKTLAPEYAKAAKALADQSNVKLVKVDSTVHTEISEQFEVQGYPTLKWIRNGKAAEYTGGRTVGEITSWVRRKSGPASAEAATVDSAKATFKVGSLTFFHGSLPSAHYSYCSNLFLRLPRL